MLTPCRGKGAGRKAAEAAARSLGVEVAPLAIQRVEDFSPAFKAIKTKADAVYVAIDQLMVANLMRILTLALGARLPTIFSARDFVRGGGFMSYRTVRARGRLRG